MRKALIFLYNVLYILLAPVIVLYVLYRAVREERYRVGWLEKLAVKLPDESKANVLWVHAVSVGETLLVAPLVERIKETFGEGVSIYFSTTTYTGREVAEKKLARYVSHFFYFPIDFYPFILRVINRIKPKAIMIVETEIWPSLLYCAFQKEIPVYMVNGRISDRSFGRYLVFSGFFKHFLQVYKKAFVRSLTDKVRLTTLGMNESSIVVTGNLKYYSTFVQARKIDPESVRRELGLGTERIIVFGSTHSGEEEIFADVVKRLIADGFKVIVVPRHPERAIEVANMFLSRGLEVSLMSQCRWCASLIVVDTIGKLMSLYSIASVSVIGGSFVPKGGHNPLEPLVFGVPVIIGPYYSNFEDVVSYLRDFIVVVEDYKDVYRKISELAGSKIDRGVLEEKLKSFLNGPILIIEELAKIFGGDK